MLQVAAIGSFVSTLSGGLFADAVTQATASLILPSLSGAKASVRASAPLSLPFTRQGAGKSKGRKAKQFEERFHSGLL
ncbi:MAG: hypothetical protein K9G43_09455 [Rhodobacteraceae bacterium]|nr:hypothetical protein [Paracoccaceae bacterium]